ncbi:MAG TPA: hypothetical protein VGM06_17265 [Polyangiaceae bacterium]
MDRRLVRFALLAGVLSVAVFTTRFVAAAPNDAAAQKLRDQAIDQDYLATNYAAAEKKLTDALSLCKKTSDCSPFIRARLHCDLGVVEYMLHKVDLARTEFATALLEDPNVDLDKDLANTDVQKEFAAAKGGGPPPPEAPAAPAAAPSAPAPSGAAPPSDQGAAGSDGSQTGGLSHVAPRRQAFRTPLPLYVEVAPDLSATKVVVRYKPIGAGEFKTMTLDKKRKGFAGQIPCEDVGGREGELLYYVQALDANGDLVGSSGRSLTPHTVSIVRKLDGEAPHLPGEAPPEACASASSAAPPPSTDNTTADTSDCPPGFPGCHADNEPSSCESRDDCTAGEDCIDRVCKKSGDDDSGPFKKNWIWFGVQADLLSMPGANPACAGGQGYSCFRSDNGAYLATTPVANFDDQVLSGFATAPMVRILIGYDRALGNNFSLGGRLGYTILGGGPQRPAANGNDAGPSFMPIHLEARVAYWFGAHPFAHKGVRFNLFLSGGLTEVDASQNIDLQTAPGTVPIFVDAWRKTGTGFVAGGPAIMYAVSRNGGITLEVKPEILFPTFGFAVAGTLGYAIGL